jgi:hypothetical protein
MGFKKLSLSFPQCVDISPPDFSNDKINFTHNKPLAYEKNEETAVEDSTGNLKQIPKWKRQIVREKE